MTALDPHPLVGASAPAFDLETSNGERVQLDQRRGRNVVLFFVREFS